MEVAALKENELNLIQTFAEGILDSIATMKAGVQQVKGFLLRINEENNIEIVQRIDANVQ